MKTSDKVRPTSQVSPEKVTRAMRQASRSREPVIPHVLTPGMWRLEPGLVSDVPSIIHDWCSDEYVKVSRLTNEDSEIFKVGMRARISRILSPSLAITARLLPSFFEAHPLAEPGKNIAGWCVYALEKETMLPVIHFTYVKAKCRRQGIAHALLHAAGVTPDTGAWCTHDRNSLGKIMRQNNIMYNKYLLEYDSCMTPLLKLR